MYPTSRTCPKHKLPDYKFMLSTLIFSHIKQYTMVYIIELSIFNYINVSKIAVDAKLIKYSLQYSAEKINCRGNSNTWFSRI